MRISISWKRPGPLDVLAPVMQLGRFRTWSGAVLFRKTLLKNREYAWDYYQKVAPKLDITWPFKRPSDGLARFAKHVLASTKKDRLKYLEVGAFEGRSAAFVYSLLGGNVDITVIDAFDANPEIPDAAMRKAYGRFSANMTAIGAADAVRVLDGKSVDHLPKLLLAGETFDIIFIDGSHATIDVFVDTAICWKLLSPGGLMIFDDYWYRRPEFGRGYRPKLAIDGFVGAMSHEIDILDVAAQAFIRKRSKERS